VARGGRGSRGRQAGIRSLTASERRAVSAARSRLYGVAREFLSARGYLEVETPCLLAAPGMEPHITAFEAPFRPEMPGPCARTVYLQTSPEYAMKRLLAEGFGSAFQICKVFRNGEVSPAHNPEFTMLEFYRSPGRAEDICEDLETLVAAAAQAIGNRSGVALSVPFERLTVRQALARHAKLDLAGGSWPSGAELRSAAEARGLAITGDAGTFDDVFFQVFLTAVEPHLGRDRPVFLTEYPASMASLARLKHGDPTVAERFELYVGGVELANGFGELNDAPEQRRRLVSEQDQRRAAGRPIYPLDERFLAAVGKMPPSGGVAVGLDRLLMLLLGAKTIEEVLLFPASSEWS
jgi:elongation factor P--(R)-beta-lysine ligase